MRNGDLVPLVPPNFLLEFADHYHLLPLALLFVFLGMVTAFEMAAACCLRACGGLAEKYYDCKTQWAVQRRRYEQRTQERRSPPKELGCSSPKGSL